MEAVLGAELMVHRDGKVSRMPTAAALAGKRFIALYFSAHWCGPCRKFTPLLSVCYEDQPEKDEVEVVFVSSDHDVEGFDEYLCVGGWGAGAALRVASSPARRFRTGSPLASPLARARPRATLTALSLPASTAALSAPRAPFPRSGEMPWSAVPFDAAGREERGEKFGVTGIPRVIVLDARDASVVNSDARALIAAKKTLGGIFQAAPAAAGGAGGASA